MSLSLAEVLARNRLFRGMAPALIDELAAAADFVDLRGGSELFAAGSAPDCLYLVVTGRLRAQLGPERSADIGVGEAVGEIGLISGDARIAPVCAVRDSLLVRIDAPALLAVLQRYPQALLSLARVVIHRLQENQTEAAGRGRITNLAMLETRPGRGLDEAVRRMQQALSRWGAVEVIDEAAVEAALGAGVAEMPYSSDAANLDLVRWLHQRETEAAFLIYTARRASAPWLRRCLRQADSVLLLADAEEAVSDSTLLDVVGRLQLQVPIAVLLRRGRVAQPVQALAWRAVTGASTQHYWRSGEDHQIVSLARQLAGHGNGLVLGGGGARGFAHLGLMRALEELAIPVDLVGGSSMGSYIAALKACGLSSVEMIREARASFVDHNYLNDFMLPRVSLIRGRKILGRLETVFGQRRIEELDMPFFCVSTNLSRGRAEVHRTGSLALWVATSMAVPGVAPPVAWRGDLLADGSVVNSLPTDVMRELARGPVLSSSVSTEGAIHAPGVEGPDPEALLNWRSESPRPSLFDILFRTATMTSESGNKARAALADVHLRMPVAEIGLFDWGAIDRVVRIGYEHAIAELSEHRESLQ